MDWGTPPGEWTQYLNKNISHIQRKGTPYKVRLVGFLNCYGLGIAVFPPIFCDPNGRSSHVPVIPMYIGCVCVCGGVQIVQYFNSQISRSRGNTCKPDVENCVYIAWKSKTFKLDALQLGFSDWIHQGGDEYTLWKSDPNLWFTRWQICHQH